MPAARREERVSNFALRTLSGLLAEALKGWESWLKRLLAGSGKLFFASEMGGICDHKQGLIWPEKEGQARPGQGRGQGRAGQAGQQGRRTGRADAPKKARWFPMVGGLGSSL